MIAVSSSLGFERVGSVLEDVQDELPRGLREGRREAFDAVYRAELDYVLMLLGQGFTYRTAQGDVRTYRVTSAFDLEELVQEAFSVFFARCKSGGFDTSRPVRPYLRRVAINAALKRGGRRSREVLADDLSAVGPTSSSATEQPVLDEETGALLEAFKASLDDTERDVLEAYFGEERTSQAALGERLGLSRDKVYRMTTKIRSAAVDFFKARGWLDES